MNDMVGRHFAWNDRPLTITGVYEGHGPDDPNGYYYVFDNAPGVSHWVSASALGARFVKLPRPEPTELDAVCAAQGLVQSASEPYIWGRLDGTATVHIFPDGEWRGYGVGERCLGKGKTASRLEAFLINLKLTSL